MAIQSKFNIANKHATSNVQITLKVYDNSATSDNIVLSKVPIPPNTTLSLDKPINLEADDALKVAATHTDCEIFASVLERSLCTMVYDMKRF